jgi:hypothetical protein
VRFLVALVMGALAACGTAEIGPPPIEAEAGVDAAPPDAVAPVAPDARVCTLGDARAYDPVSGHCIAFFEALATWLEARNACNAAGGILAMPTTMQENDLYHPIATNLLTDPDAWLGGTDATTEGTFAWIDPAEPFMYTHWRTGEPNNGGTSGTQEDCVVMENDTAGTWDDRPCTRAYPYFCEIP